MCDWLAENGWDDVFLDLDPERGIVAGERWERALHKAATRCEAIVFLVSQNWLASDWCLKEYTLARGLNKKLFAALIDPGKKITDLPPALKETWQIVDLTGGELRLFRVAPPGSHEEKHVGFGLEGLRRLKRGLESAGLDAKFFEWPPAGDPKCAPYRGLTPLEAEDAGVFFGRDAPIIEATDRLRGLCEAEPPRLLVILGASGAGKSSFLRAGLLPRLARDDRSFLPLAVIRPGRAVLSGESGLLHALEAAFPGRARASLRAALSRGASGVMPLLKELVAAHFAQRVGEDDSKPPAIVVAVDQAEELFRAEGAEESAAFLALLRDVALCDEPKLIVLFAIRSDAYDALEHAEALHGLPQGAMPLLPLPRGAYKEVIEGPLRRVSQAGGKLVIEPQLTERLLEDIERGAGSDALPLLAFTLEQLYREYGSAGALRLSDYEAFGGLKGAINAAVARAFQRADADPRIPSERAAREALLRRGLIPWLAGVDPLTKSPRRNIARVDEIPPEAGPLISLLIEERLLSTNTREEKNVAGAIDRVVTIEPTHEALLRQWGLLEGWLEEDFALLATLEGVKRAARDWDANARDTAWAAHGGARLEEAGALDARPDIAAKLDTTDRTYLAACRDKEKAARAAEEEQRRVEAELAREKGEKLAERARAAKRVAWITSIGLVVAALLAVVAVGFGFYAFDKKELADQKSIVAQQQTDIAQQKEREAFRNQSAALAASSKISLAENPTRAVKLALAAWPRKSDSRASMLPVALDALGAAVAESRERGVLRGHEGYVWSAAFSSDGARIVTASKDYTARVWDAATGKPIAKLEGHKFSVQSAVFSPDGARIVTASEEKTARVWDAATGQRIAALEGHEREVFSAVFSPDGARIVTASADTTARVWDAATGQRIVVLKGHEAGVRSAAFSPDGTRIVTASADTTARVWDAATGQRIVVLKGHEAGVGSAAFSPEGARIVTASDDKTARLWDAATGQRIVVLKGHNDKVWRAAFSSDGARIVTASWDKTARVWDAATGKPIAVLEGHAGNVLSAVFSPDGARIVTASDDKTARLWDAATGTPIAVLKGHNDIVWRAAFSSDGARIVTASWDKTARVWDAATGKPIAVLNDQKDKVWSAVFSPDGARIITASEDTTARVWDAATGKLILPLKGHERGVLGAVFSPDGARIVTASDDSTAKVWDASTGQPIAGPRGHEGYVSSAVFSPDGARIVTASKDQTAEVWDAATGEPLGALWGHQAQVWSAVFSPDGARILTAGDATARVWDAATGQRIAALEGHEREVFSAVFSPDGARIVTASADKTARVWDAATGQRIVVLKGHEAGVGSAVFSPDGARIVTASADKTARVWDAATGKPIVVLKGHAGNVLSAVFSPDGARIVTASADKTARVWDTATGQPIAVLKGHNDIVWRAAFSPDGTRIVTASWDHTARLWDVSAIPKGNIFAVGCAWLPDHDLSGIAKDYGFTNLDPICDGDPPLPDPLSSANEASAK